MTKGVYVLAIWIKEDFGVNVGALGRIDFVKGLYAYVGSAQGGLEKRVERHFGKSKRKFWHIDYLLDNEIVEILKVFHKEARRTEECKIAQKISHTSLPVDGFGSSDCKCASHLFRLKSYQTLETLMHETNMKTGSLI